MKIREQFQYTFRVEGTSAQIIETAYSLEEAKEQAADFWLAKQGHRAGDPSYAEAKAEIVAHQLRLVFVR